MNKTTFLGDKPINRMGYGAMQLAGPGVSGPPKDADGAREVLRRAVELGVDHIDTAQFYGPDTVNELIREALHPYPENLKLVTKVGARRDDSGGWLPAQSPAQLRDGVHENLRSLQVEKMDCVNLRRLEEGQGDPVPLEDQLGALEELRQEGKLDLIGISNVSRAQAQHAFALSHVAQVQNAYSIVDREDEPVLALCREQEVAFVPFFPLGSAFTGGPAMLARDQTIASVADKHGASASQIALAWLLARYERMLLIPGTASVAHLEENLAAAEIALDQEDLDALEGVPPVARPTR